MVSLNGVTLKAYKTFMGHEGPCAQGNVYYKNKKIGFWSQDSWGGPDFYEFDTSLPEEPRKKYEECLPETQAKEFYKDLDSFLYLITFLKDIEKQIKKFRKKGFQTVMLVSNGWELSFFAVSTKLSFQDIQREYPEVIKNYEKNEKCVFHVFYSPEIELMADKDHPLPDYLAINHSDYSDFKVTLDD